jgi:hypothetical protein
MTRERERRKGLSLICWEEGQNKRFLVTVFNEEPLLNILKIK